MKNSEFQVPDIIKADTSRNSLLDRLRSFLLSDVRTKLRKEDELVNLLLSYEFRYGCAGDLAARSALGEIRLPHIIPAQLSEEVVRRAGPLSVSRGLASIYILICSSLYYETLDKQIDLRNGRKYVKRLFRLFNNHLGALSTDGLFTNTFGNALDEYRLRINPPPKVPEDLLDILDHPSLMEEKFSCFFNKMQQFKS